jgi:GT2 family glycosyltransferase
MFTDHVPDFDGAEGHVWNKANIGKVAAMRNAGIEAFLATDAEYLFIVDADLILHPKLVEHLVSLNKDIVSEVFWTVWPSDGAEGLHAPNVWDYQPYSHKSVESITEMREPMTKRVGGLGACTLIHRRVLENPNMRFDPVPSLMLEGEDRWFCVRAEANGFELWADTHYPPFHVYRREQLDEARIWFAQGSAPNYFRECWLTDEWVEKANARASKPMGTKSTKSIAICLPGQVFSEQYVAWLMQTYAWVGARMRSNVYHGYTSNASVTRQAMTNRVLADFADGGVADYVLWIDDDNVMTPGYLEMLIQDLDAHPELDMVVGWCAIATDTFDPTVTRTSVGVFDANGRCVALSVEDLESAKGLIKIEWTGFPVVLMRGALLAEMGARAFRPLIDDASDGYGFFGEDASFSKQLLLANKNVAVDPRVKVPHLKLRDANPGVSPFTIGRRPQVMTTPISVAK